MGGICVHLPQMFISFGVVQIVGDDYNDDDNDNINFGTYSFFLKKS